MLLREAGIILIALNILATTSNTKLYILRSREGERNKEGGKSLYFEIKQSKDKINKARIEECQRTLYIL